MNFKEALIAHLRGEKVEAKHEGWKDFAEFDTSFAHLPLKDLNSEKYDNHLKFRLAPRTIFVNGVEVPAGEKVAPDDGVDYYFAAPNDESYFARSTWTGHELDNTWFERGLVYLNKEDAIARAKAMLLTSDKQQELSVSQLADKMAERRGYICQSVTGSRDGDTMTYTIECVRPNKSDA